MGDGLLFFVIRLIVLVDFLKPCTCINLLIKNKYTMEYHSAFKKKKILTHATNCMKLGDMMVSEIS